MGKLLFQCSVRECHNNVIKYVDKGGLKYVWSDIKLLISETDLRFIILE